MLWARVGRAGTFGSIEPQQSILLPLHADFALNAQDRKAPPRYRCGSAARTPP